MKIRCLPGESRHRGKWLVYWLFERLRVGVAKFWGDNFRWLGMAEVLILLGFYDKGYDKWAEMIEDG